MHDNIVANDKAIDFNLKQVIKRTKQDNKIYSNLAETLLDGQITLEPEWLSKNDFLTYIAFGVSLFNTLWLIWVCYKYKTIARAFFLIGYKSVQAAPTYRYDLGTTTTEKNTIWNTLQETVTDHTFTVAFLLFNIMLFLIKNKENLGQDAVFRDKRFFFLEISNYHDCQTVEVMQVPFCLAHWNVIPPDNIENISVTGSVSPKLTVTWQNVCLNSKLNSNIIQLPGVISWTIYQALKIRQLLKGGSYSAYVLIAHQNIYYPFKPNNRQSTADVSQQLCAN